MTFWGDYLEARQKATRTRQRYRTEGANHRDRELRRDAAEEISLALSRAASVPARHLALIVVGFLLVCAISRDGAIFKILHRGCDRLPNPLERHLTPSI